MTGELEKTGRNSIRPRWTAMRRGLSAWITKEPLEAFKDKRFPPVAVRQISYQPGKSSVVCA